MNVDQMYRVEDFSRKTIAALCDALEHSTTQEQRVYREAELDELWRIVHTDLTVLRRNTQASSKASALEHVLTIIREAHDLVGAEEAPAFAAARLRTIGNSPEVEA